MHTWSTSNFFGQVYRRFCEMNQRGPASFSLEMRCIAVRRFIKWLACNCRMINSVKFHAVLAQCYDVSFKSPMFAVPFAFLTMTLATAKARACWKECLSFSIFPLSTSWRCSTSVKETKLLWPQIKARMLASGVCNNLVNIFNPFTLHHMTTANIFISWDNAC